VATTLHVDRSQLLRSSALLRDLPPEALQEIGQYIRIATFKAGEVVFRKGEPGRGLMTLVRGRVKITTRLANGRQAVLNVAKPGELFGEIALIDGGPRTADAVVVEDATVLVLDRRDFLPFLEHNPQVSIKLLNVLCDRIRQSTVMTEDALFLDVPSRIARTLLRLAGHDGTEIKSGVRIELRLSQAELGNSAGVTRESVNRQLRDWRERGLVELDDGRLVLTDVEALREEIRSSG